MDHHHHNPFHHHRRHHPRYVPPPPHPPPPSTLSVETSFYNLYHPHFLPSPHQLPPPTAAAPPLPSQLFYQPLPPPPPPPPPPPTLFESPQSLFTFLNTTQRPIDDRPLFDSDDHRRPHLEFETSRTDTWEPSRVPSPRNRLLPRLDFDRKQHYSHSFNLHDSVSPYRPVDKFTHEPETSFGFREDYSDVIDCDDYHNNGQFVSNPNKSSRSYGYDHFSPSLLSREYAGNMGVYEVQPGSVSDELFRDVRGEGLSENYRRGHTRKFCLVGIKENHKSDGSWIDSGKRVSLALDSGKYSSRGSRESSGEFVRTPWKKPQKKSALLRLQKPASRNRNDPSALSFDGSQPSSGKGKEPVVHSGHRAEEKREGSPVELDVSFRSNTLVAKAIATPSSPAVVCDRNLTLRTRNLRKVTVPNRNSSCLQLTKHSVSPEKSGGLIHVAHDPSSSNKELKLSEDRIEVSGVGATPDTDSPLRSIQSNGLLIKSMVEGSEMAAVSDRVDNLVGCDGTPPVKTRKKMKVVTPSCSVEAGGRKKHDESANADSSSCSPSAASKSFLGVRRLKEKVTSAGMVMKCEALSQSSLKKVTNEEYATPECMVSDKVDGDVDPGRSCMHKVRRRCSSNHVLDSSSPEKTSNEISDLSIDCLHMISSSDNGLTNLKDSSISFDIGTVNTRKLSGLNDVVMQPVNNNLTGFSDFMTPVEGNIDVPVSSSEEFTIHKDSVDAYISGAMNNNQSSDNCAIKKKEIVCVSGIDTEDCKHCHSHQIQLSLENGIVSSEEIGASLAFLNSDSSDHSRGTTSGSDTDLFHLQQKLTVCNIIAVDGICKLPFPDGVTASPENGSTHGSTKAKVSLGSNLCVGSDKEHAPESRRKLKVSTLQSDLPSSHIVVSNLGLANVVDSSFGVDEFFCSIKDCDLGKEGSTDSGFVSSVVGLEPCTDADSTMQGTRSTDGLNGLMVAVRDDVNDLSGLLPKLKKKREVFSVASVSDINGGCQSASPLRIGTAVLSNCDEFIAHAEDEVAAPVTGMINSTGLLPSSEGMGNCLKGRSSETGGSGRDGFGNDCSKSEGPWPHLCTVQESSILNLHSDCSSGLVAEQKENVTIVTATTNDQTDDMDVQSENIHGMLHGKFAQHSSPLEPQISNLLPSTVMDCDSLHPGNDLPCLSNSVSLCAHRNVASYTKYDHGLINSSPNDISNTGPPNNLSSDTDLLMLSATLPLGEISHEEYCGDERRFDENPITDGDSLLPVCDLFQDSNSSFVYATESDHLSPGESVPLHSQDLKNITESLKPKSGESYRQKGQLTYAAPRGYPGYSPNSFNSSKNAVSSNSTARPRTWHRTANPPGTLAVARGTYVRKGNSLVRKSASVASFPKSSHGLSSSAYWLSPSSKSEISKGTVSSNRVDMMDPSNCLRIELNAPLERPAKRSTQHSTKLSNCITIASGDYMSTPQASPLLDECSENMSHPPKLCETKDPPKSSEDVLNLFLNSENQINSSINFEDQGAVTDGNITLRKLENIIYVKGKSNQLVAVSNRCDTSIHDVDKIHASSDGYYKRNKNQLVRTSSKNLSWPTVLVPGDSSNSEEQRALKVVSSRSLNRKRSEFVKKFKPLKFALVWTLGDTQSSKKAVFPSQCKKVLPHLVPWKRATYWRRSLHNSASNNSSLSMISKKLLLLRKRDAVYTRSSHGFSLRKSKVLSIGGANLKWSKSIEKRSKKANEEATIAVAEVERRKRQQSTDDCVASRTSRNHSSRKSVHNTGICPGERIFRIGLDRYKMDSSGRTLQRISDDESCPMPIQTDNNLKKSYVPRRLLIGNDEYVRIGNGNQLIRDPKKRTRILANEKVRWSLHTARLRLAKKQKYCQFYTRFGKCNKDSGKCPYIHDPSKIVVCTKFLNGFCSNLNCKLTHKIIPERMQDCSYFLLGLCSNERCPYRHVNVNPNASICEGFLKGYCADGDECRKKHSYVCPDYEATGSCPRGSKCKLHHPKKQNKGKKRKRPEGVNTWGRYFGFLHVDNAEPKVSVRERHCLNDIDEIFVKDGRFADYISLDVSDEEVGEAHIPMSKRTNLHDDDSLGIQLDDLEKLIKPIRIMH